MLLKMKSPSTLCPPSCDGVMQQPGGNEAFSGLLEPWGRGSACGGAGVSSWWPPLLSRTWGWHESCSSIPSSIPLRWEAGHVQLPARQRCRGSSAFWGSSGLPGAASCRFQRFWGLWEEDFQRCGATWHCHPGEVAVGRSAPAPLQLTPMGAGGLGCSGRSVAKLPQKAHCSRSRSPVSGQLWHQPVQCQDPAFPCGTPGSQGRCGAAGGRDAASTCLHSDRRQGGERGNFPDSFPHLKGKKREGVA